LRMAKVAWCEGHTIYAARWFCESFLINTAVFSEIPLPNSLSFVLK
jgi:hypothetical protein